MAINNSVVRGTAIPNYSNALKEQSAMIFIANRYTRIYYSVIKRAQCRILPEDTYIEKHHIIPRCMGGTDDPTNIVSLTFKEHLFCHKLLVRMVKGTSRGKLSFAVLLMARKKSNSIIYTAIKNNAREYAREYNKGKIPITNGKVTKFLFKDQTMPDGFYCGWSDEYLKKKIGNNKGKIYITDGINYRTLLADETIPTGWYYGQADSHKEKNSIANAGINNAMYGLFFITNGIENSVCDLVDKIPDGWYKGKVEIQSEKKSASKQGNKNPNFGKVARNAIPVEINGVVYNSAAEARRAGYSRRTIENIYKKGK